MAQGDLISRANYVNTWGTGWLGSYYTKTSLSSGFMGSASSHSESYYVAAPCIYVEFGTYHKGPKSTSATMKISKFNGSSFEEFKRFEINEDISYDSDWKYRYLRHNYGGSSSDDTSKDDSDRHLWKIECSWYQDGWLFVRTEVGIYLNIQYGGIGCVPDNSTYNYMWKPGSKLYACPCAHWSTSSYGSDTAFIDANRPEAFTGQPITASNGYMAYSVRE